ncbi:MFS transporter [Oscillatoria amoena NRMC-F 0135]|nr:MFS transporter [Oscillatoria amoena NRMC-F 0135]
MHFGFSGKPQWVNPSLPLWFFAFIPFKLGESLLIVTLPLLIVQGVGGTVGDVARIHALTALVGVVGFIFWGNLSDRLRVRRPFLILGFLGFGFCTSLLSFAETLPQAILYSTLNGFFMTSITPASSALVVDSFPEQEWSGYFGRFYQMSGWSFVASLVLGIVWLTGRSSLVDPETALRRLVLFAGIITFLSVLLCWGWVKEPHHHQPRRRFSPQLLGRLTVAVIEKRATFYPARLLYFVWHPDLLKATFREALPERPRWKTLPGMAFLETRLGRYCLCSLFLFISFNLIFVPLPIFLTERLQVTNAQIFAIALSKASLETWFYVPIGRYIQQHSGWRLQIQATAARCGLFGIFTLLALTPPHSSNLLIVGLVQLFNGVTWAAISVSGTTAIARLAPKSQEGLAIGFYNASIGVATAVGSLGSGFFALRFGYSACFGLATCIAALSTLWLYQLQRESFSTSLTHPND